MAKRSDLDEEEIPSGDGDSVVWIASIASSLRLDGVRPGLSEETLL